MRERSSRLPPLNGLRAFEAAARHLNFRLAAEELGVTQGAVAQQVRGLEADLGIKLFDRLPRSTRLDHSGARLRRSSAPRLRADGGGHVGAAPGTLAVDDQRDADLRGEVADPAPARLRRRTSATRAADTGQRDPGELPVRRSRRRRTAGPPALRPRPRGGPPLRAGGRGRVQPGAPSRPSVSARDGRARPVRPPTRRARPLARVRGAGPGAAPAGDVKAGPTSARPHSRSTRRSPARVWRWQAASWWSRTWRPRRLVRAFAAGMRGALDSYVVVPRRPRRPKPTGLIRSWLLAHGRRGTGGVLSWKPNFELRHHRELTATDTRLFMPPWGSDLPTRRHAEESRPTAHRRTQHVVDHHHHASRSLPA